MAAAGGGMTAESLSGTPSLPSSYVKALLGSLPLVGGGGDDLPEAELTLPEVTIDRKHLAAYDRVCGFRLADELPPTYLHVHAFPVAMRLMTDRSFPLPLLGLVHVTNRIVQERPVRAAEAVSLRVRAENLRRTERGSAVDLVAFAEAGGERVWSSTSTYLRRGGPGGGEGGSSSGGDGEGRSTGRGDGDGRSDRGGGEPSEPAASRPAATWRLPGDAGRRYAAVSGDINPIHLHPLTARLFGFPRAIAHGMWTKARCLAALEGRIPERAVIEVEFRKPVLLPSKVEFASSRSPGGRSFELRSAGGGATHLEGSVRSG